MLGFGLGGDDDEFGILALDGFTCSTYWLPPAAQRHPRLPRRRHGFGGGQEHLWRIVPRRRSAGMTVRRFNPCSRASPAGKGSYSLCRLVAATLLFLYTLDAVSTVSRVLRVTGSVSMISLSRTGFHPDRPRGRCCRCPTAQHVNDGVALADVAQELVARSFTFAGALHRIHVYDVAHSRPDTPQVNQTRRASSVVHRVRTLSHLGVDYRRKFAAYCLCAAQAVEKSGFSYVGKRGAHDTSF